VAVAVAVGVEAEGVGVEGGRMVIRKGEGVAMLENSEREGEEGGGGERERGGN
jgi:hypothetical protein